MGKTIEDIRILVENNNYVVSSKLLQESGIERFTIEKLIKQSVLAKLSYGLYCLFDNQPDEFLTIQSRSEKIVYSNATALFLQGLSDRIPINLDITIPQGYNVGKVKRDYPNLHFYYSKSEFWNLGITQVTTPQGFVVNVYDKEKTILDIMRNKENIDSQIYTQAIKQYFSGKPNLRKLIKYSRLMKMEEQIRNYIEIL